MCSEAKWRDLSDHFEAWQTIYSVSVLGETARCLRLCSGGFVWSCDRTVILIQVPGRLTQPLSVQRVRPQVPLKKGNQALERSRGGLTLKLYCFAPEHHIDSRYFTTAPEEVCLPSLLGDPIKRRRTALADKNHDSKALRQYYDRFRSSPSSHHVRCIVAPPSRQA